MSTSGGDEPLIEKWDDLAEWLAAGSKPKDEWRIGTEHEKFGFYTDTLKPVPYEGERGVGALLRSFAERFHWKPIMEGDNIIGLSCRSGANISLEPGGQFELSGAPLEHLYQTCNEVHRHLAQVREVGEELGIGFLGLGFSPKWSLSETPRMPKGRYAIMSEYMQKVGTRGLDMMYRTCTVQVNLDFSSEADMVKKFRVGLALQPIATAIFANSPFADGKPNGMKSLRSDIWRNTDPDRTGMLHFVFEDGMGFERYAEHALDVPMYFVYRDGKYIDVSGQSFRDFMEGKLAGLPGEKPTLSDWSDHLTTLFPEVRLKRFLEMRGADGGPWRRLCALPALWVGLLYDSASLDAAWDICKDWTREERQQLRDEVPRLGLQMPFRGGTVQDIAKQVVAVAVEGLKARNIVSSDGFDERYFLGEVEEIVASGRSPAVCLLERYHGRWKENIDMIFSECAY